MRAPRHRRRQQRRRHERELRDPRAPAAGRAAAPPRRPPQLPRQSIAASTRDPSPSADAVRDPLPDTACTRKSSAGGTRGCVFEIGSGCDGDDRGDQMRLALAFERFPARHHLVQDGAEGEDVGARVGFLAFELFGRHVLHRAEDRARAPSCSRRPPRSPRPTADAFACSVSFARPKSSSLAPLCGQHDVARLQIAMRDALAVRLVQRVGDRDRHLQRLVERQRPRASRAASVSPSRYSITRKSIRLRRPTS